MNDSHIEFGYRACVATAGKTAELNARVAHYLNDNPHPKGGHLTNRPPDGAQLWPVINEGIQP